MRYLLIILSFPLLSFGQGYLFEKNENGTYLNVGCAAKDDVYSTAMEAGRSYNGVIDFSLGFANTNPRGINSLIAGMGFHPVKQDSIIPLSLAFHIGIIKVLSGREKPEGTIAEASLYFKLFRRKKLTILGITSISTVNGINKKRTMLSASLGFAIKNSKKGKIYIGPSISQLTNDNRTIIGVNISFISLYNQE